MLLGGVHGEEDTEEEDEVRSGEVVVQLACVNGKEDTGDEDDWCGGKSGVR